jgi:small subunit ribosomal protein S7
MPRRRAAVKREPVPDWKFNSTLVAKFISTLMRDGKKSTAEGVFYEAMDIMKEKSSDSPINTLKQAVDNVKPLLEVKSRRVGGATYQVPIDVRPERRLSLALRWIVLYASERPEKGMGKKLASELLDASRNQGGAVKKREDTHKMAEANKAFVHYRW